MPVACVKLGAGETRGLWGNMSELDTAMMHEIAESRLLHLQIRAEQWQDQTFREALLLALRSNDSLRSVRIIPADVDDGLADVPKGGITALSPDDDESWRQLVDALRDKPRLQALDISGCGISDGIVEYIAEHLTHLKALNAYGCTITSIGVARLLTYLPDLEVLNIANNEIDDGAVAALCGFRQMKELYVGTGKIGIPGLVRIQQTTNATNTTDVRNSGEQLNLEVWPWEFTNKPAGAVGSVRLQVAQTDASAREH